MRHFISTVLFLFFLALQAKANDDTISSYAAGLPRDTNSINSLLSLAEKAALTSNDTSLRYAEEALNIALELKNPKAELLTRFNTGIRNINIADYVEASKHLFRALDLARDLKDDHREIACLNSIGNIYAHQDIKKEALKYYNEALQLSRKTGNKKREAVILGNIGNIYYQSQAEDSSYLQRSLEYYRQALRVHRSNNDTDRMISSMNSQALALIDLKRFDEAQRMLDTTMRLMRQLGDSSDIVYAYSYLGRISRAMNRNNEALRYYFMCLDRSRAVSNLDMEMDCYMSLSETFEATGDFEKAYRYRVLYSQMSDSLVNTDNTRIITDLKNRMRAEKDENEISQLKQAKQISDLRSEKRAFWVMILVLGVVLLLVTAFLFYHRARSKEKINRGLSEKNAEIEEKNKSITDSITYARRIQHALLSSGKLVGKNFPQHFLLYKPKDIVSGDFYWAYSSGSKIFFIIADCTGHGVPGAFMSLVSISFLNEAITEKGIHRPDLALDYVREQLISSLNPEGAEEITSDGMDAVLCVYDSSTLTLEFACANNPLWLLREGKFIEYKPDKMPVGRHPDGNRPFTLHRAVLQEGDIIYLFSDGYADQFGGPQGKKFKYKQLQERLLAYSSFSMEEQGRRLENDFYSWKSGLEQVDDVLIAGIKI